MFHGVPKSVVVLSLLGLIPMLIGLASTFNIGLNDGLREDFVRIAVIYSGFILCFMSGCIFYVSSLERDKVFLLWFMLISYWNI